MMVTSKRCVTESSPYFLSLKYRYSLSIRMPRKLLLFSALNTKIIGYSLPLPYKCFKVAIRWGVSKIPSCVSYRIIRTKLSIFLPMYPGSLRPILPGRVGLVRCAAGLVVTLVCSAPPPPNTTQQSAVPTPPPCRT